MIPAMPKDSAFIDERALSKLRWRCRRGLLENDLFIERFFNEHGEQVTVSEAQGLDDLMDLSDNDLLDLLLQRKQPKELQDRGASTAEALEVLHKMRRPHPPRDIAA
jgi:antitoxin CptB